MDLPGSGNLSTVAAFLLWNVTQHLFDVKATTFVGRLLALVAQHFDAHGP